MTVQSVAADAHAIAKAGVLTHRVFKRQTFVDCMHVFTAVKKPRDCFALPMAQTGDIHEDFLFPFYPRGCLTQNSMHDLKLFRGRMKSVKVQADWERAKLWMVERPVQILRVPPFNQRIVEQRSSNFRLEIRGHVAVSISRDEADPLLDGRERLIGKGGKVIGLAPSAAQPDPNHVLCVRKIAGEEALGRQRFCRIQVVSRRNPWIGPDRTIIPTPRPNDLRCLTQEPRQDHRFPFVTPRQNRSTCSDARFTPDGVPLADRPRLLGAAALQ